MSLTGITTTKQESALQRTIASVGDLSRYAGYLPVVFVLYALYDFYLSDVTGLLQQPLRDWLGWLYALLLNPLLWAGLMGGIQELLHTPASMPAGLLEAVYGQPAVREGVTLGGFLSGMRRLFWKAFGASLLVMLPRIIALVIIAIVTRAENAAAVAEAYVRFEDIFLSGIMLFWLAGMASGAGLLGGLWRALRTLIRNPLALGIALAWGLLRFGDDAASAALAHSGPQMLRLVPPLALGAVRIVFTAYAIAVDRQHNASAEEQPAPAGSVAAPADSKGLIFASVVSAVGSFLPFVHLIAILLGLLALKRSKRFVWRAAIACCLGGFFTIAYGLLTAGIIVGPRAAARTWSYTFLAEANSELTPQVALLEDRSFGAVRSQLEMSSPSSPARSWTVDAALALAKWGDSDRDGALDSFYTASQAKPERSEFYYYYGLALLDNGQTDMALAQFRQATAREPDLPVADRYVALMESVYKAPSTVSAIFYIIALLILFSLHEFGHALAAWKLGDDTARNQGRLTLNPIKHLDPFGSILLPAILLFSHSDFMFGWARPVPVNPQNFKNPRKDHMRVSLAGPAMNLLVAMLCFVLLELSLLVIRLLWPATLTWQVIAPAQSISMVGPPVAGSLVLVIVFIKQLMYTSLALGIFNLLPIPPLDGSWILEGVLPQGIQPFFALLRQFGFVLFMLLAATPIIGNILGWPIGLWWGAMQLFASTLGLG